MSDRPWYVFSRRADTFFQQMHGWAEALKMIKGVGDDSASAEAMIRQALKNRMQR